jgi:hypothetical protein
LNPTFVETSKLDVFRYEEMHKQFLIELNNGDNRRANETAIHMRAFYVNESEGQHKQVEFLTTKD